jgi:cell division transport system permease protein
MSARLRAIGYGVGRAVRGFGRHPWSAALSTGAIAVALLLVALVHLAASNVRGMTDVWGGGVQMVVYLDDGVGKDHADAIASVLEQLPAVETIHYVSPADAHERLRGSLGEHGALLEGIEVGLLPASLEVELREGVSDVAAVHPVVERLRATAGVESVEFLDDWVGKLTALLGALRLAALVLGLIVAGACLYIIATTVKLSLVERRSEMEVYDLVGASGSFIRGPLLIEGAMQGALGAIAAAFLLWALYAAGAGPLTNALEAAFGNVSLAFLPTRDIALLVGGGAMLGVTASWFATGRRRALA